MDPKENSIPSPSTEFLSDPEVFSRPPVPFLGQGSYVGVATLFAGFTSAVKKFQYDPYYRMAPLRIKLMGAVPSAIIGGICGQLGFMAARSLQSIQHEIRLIELKQGEEQRKIRQKIYYAVEEVQNES